MNSADVPSAYQTLIATLQALLGPQTTHSAVMRKAGVGQDDSSACDQYLGISEQTAHHGWDVHVWGLVAAARRERRDL